MIRIVSSLPGRLRLRGDALRDPAALRRLSDDVARWRHVAAVEANPRTGSLLVHYDAARLKPETFEARIAAAFAAPASAAPHPARAAAHGGTPRVRANRYAKRAMLISLAVSLLLAGAGRKRWHALAGGLFVASLAVHLWVHRRHVFR